MTITGDSEIRFESWKESARSFLGNICYCFYFFILRTRNWVVLCLAGNQAATTRARAQGNSFMCNTVNRLAGRSDDLLEFLLDGHGFWILSCFFVIARPRRACSITPPALEAHRLLLPGSRLESLQSRPHFSFLERQEDHGGAGYTPSFPCFIWLRGRRKPGEVVAVVADTNQYHSHENLDFSCFPNVIRLHT